MIFMILSSSIFSQSNSKLNILKDGWYQANQLCHDTNRLGDDTVNEYNLWVKVFNDRVIYIGKEKYIASRNNRLNNKDIIEIPFIKIKKKTNSKNIYFAKYSYSNNSGLNIKDRKTICTLKVNPTK